MSYLTSDDALMLMRFTYQINNALENKVNQLEAKMTTAQSIMEQFATQIDDLTTKEGQDIQDVTDKLNSLRNQLDPAGQAKLQASIDKLKSTSDNLHAIASPDNPNNPVPVPTVPSDAGTPTDTSTGPTTATTGSSDPSGGTPAGNVTPGDTLNPGTNPAS